MKLIECAAVAGVLSITALGNCQTPEEAKPRGILRRSGEAISRAIPFRNKDKAPAPPELTVAEPATADPFAGMTRQPDETAPISVERGANDSTGRTPTNQRTTPQVSPTSPMIQQGVHNPANENLRRLTASQGATSRINPSTSSSEFRRSSSRLHDAIASKDDAEARSELTYFQNVSADLSRQASSLPLETRFQMEAIVRKCREGVALIEEGRASGEDCKVRMGFEQLEDAQGMMSDLGHK